LKTPHTLWRDRQWGVAILAAPAVWFFLYSVDQPAIQMNWPLSRPWLFLMLAAAYPLLEELVFRGWLQGWCMQQNWGNKDVAGITYANVATSIMFAALHIISHAPLMAALVLIPSLVFGYFRDRYNGWLVPGIMLHCFYNAGYFLLYKPAF